MILVVSEGMEPGDGGMDTRERSSSDGVLQEGTIQPSLSPVGFSHTVLRTVFL